MTMRKISISELSRVEGIGSVEIFIDGKKVRDVRVKLIEGLRFLELIPRGLLYKEVPGIVSRICAICYASHAIASSMALEKALSIKVDRRDQMLRELLLYGELLESHALHIYFLIAPDIYNELDFIELYKKDKSLVKEGFMLVKLGNMLREIIGGRPIHGLNIIPGGFVKRPSADNIDKVLEITENIIESSLILERMLKCYPEAGPIEGSVAIATGDHYLYGNRLITSTGKESKNYRVTLEEQTEEYSHAKSALHSGRPAVVGAISRVLLKEKFLSREARELLNSIEHDQKYITYNVICQAAEIVEALERILSILKELSKLNVETHIEEPYPKKFSGEGFGYIEAPRGVLVHHYLVEDLILSKANIITPTAINQKSMERAVHNHVETMIFNKGSLNENDVISCAEQIIRAFDPCISCSVHVCFIK